MKLLRCRAEDVAKREAEGWTFSRWIVGACGEFLALMERAG